MRKFLAIIICLMALSSCISRYEKHGYMFDLSDQDLVREGGTTKAELLQHMGSPTVISDLDNEETWIYFSENVRYLLFFLPKVKEREILVIRFDRHGNVKTLQRINLNDEAKKLDFASGHTPVESHKTGFFKSIFSNVGQVKPQ